jgi:hypothetical protein
LTTFVLSRANSFAVPSQQTTTFLDIGLVGGNSCGTVSFPALE